MKIETSNPEAVAKRAFFFAYEASCPMGMGFLHVRFDATEDDVWSEVAHAFAPYGDYVFGRMMKVGFNLKPDGVEFRDEAPRSDYQSWCHAYPSYQALVEAAIESLAVEYAALAKARGGA